MNMAVHDTVDHDEIRQWIQLHRGAPARVPDTESVCSAEVLLVDFLGARSGHYFEHISWAEQPIRHRLWRRMRGVARDSDWTDAVTKNSAKKKAVRAYRTAHPGTSFPEAAPAESERSE